MAMPYDDGQQRSGPGAAEAMAYSSGWDSGVAEGRAYGRREIQALCNQLRAKLTAAESALQASTAEIQASRKRIEELEFAIRDCAATIGCIGKSSKSQGLLDMADRLTTLAGPVP